MSGWVAALLAASGCGPSEAEREIAAILPGEDAPNFQNIRNRDEFVCGEVNAPDDRSGYLRFVYDEESGTASIEKPGAAPTASVDDAACGKRAAYQSVDERLACAHAPEVHEEVAERRRFERLWQANCR